MRLRHAIQLGLYLFFGILVASGHAAAREESRVALVIGNAAYQHVPALVNPINDSADVSAALERLGFTVRRVTNTRFDELRRALLEFGAKARRAEMALVFFAGHGIEVGGENWLIPVDAELKTDLDVEHETIGLRGLITMVSAASKLGLVVLDACRNNPFSARMQQTVRTRAVTRGLARIEPLGSVLVAYAAKDGTTADDGKGRNSPFSSALLKHLETPGLEINFLFRNVRDEVLASTGKRQEPFVYGSLSKEAIFLKPPAAAAVGPPPPAPGADQITWNFLKESKDGEAVRRFLAEFPASPLRAEAEARLAALAAMPKPPAIDRHELARSLQLELRRVGCFDGAVDGEYGRGTRTALRNFARFAALKLEDDELSFDLLKAVRGHDGRICPLVCRPGERADGDRCIRIVCPSGQLLKDGGCVAEVEKGKLSGTPDRRRPTAAPQSGGKCFSFQGRQFCE